MKHYFVPTRENNHTPQLLQRVALLGMLGLILLSFATVNLQALLWQSSQWLVSTILPAVVVDLTNDERAEVAAPKLVRSKLLDEAAKLKAEHMAKHQYFAHYSPEGVSPWHWFDEVGYTYAHAGENLAIHFSDSEAVVEGWMKSPTHRANIVNQKYTEIGVGTAKGTFEGFDTVYVVQLFGTPAQTTPVPAPAVPVVQNEVVPAVAVATSGAVLAEEVPTPEPTPAPKSVVAPATTVHNASTTVVSTESVSPEKIEAPAEEVAPKVVDMTMSDDGVVLYSSLIATSSGLTPALVTSAGTTASQASVLESFAVRPHAVLQTIYFVLGTVVTMLLLASITIGYRTHQPMPIVYGVLLLLVMGGLFYVHAQLMTSVVVAASPESTLVQEL